MYSNLPVTVHWRIAQISRLYNLYGGRLDFLDSSSEEASEVYSSGECILIVPKMVNLSGRSKFEHALVSGWALWMKDKKAFPLSDHSDFKQLLDFVRACRPRTVLTCFGGRFNAVFANQVEKKLGVEARPLDLIPTTFIPEKPRPRVRECVKHILKVTRMPGFIYSKKWIMNEMKPLGFSRREVEEALDNLTRRGILRISRNG